MQLKFKWMGGEAGNGVDREYWQQIFLIDLGMILVCKTFLADEKENLCIPYNIMGIWVHTSKNFDIWMTRSTNYLSD